MEKTLLPNGAALYAPKNPRALLVMAGHENAEAVAQAAAQNGAALAVLPVADWDAQLSPWAAPRAFRGGQDFAGHAQETLQTILHETIPAAKAALGGTALPLGILGYSLSGLFALYALYQTDVFSLCGCVSGSLWYDGFAAYMQAHTPLCPAARIYFSLGDKEPRTKNERLAAVGTNTQAAAALLARQGHETVFEWNEGNHFVNNDARMARAVNWLLRP